MKRLLTAIVLAAGLASDPAFAQEGPAKGTVDVTIIPGGWTFFTEGDTQGPSFGNYELGGAATFNLNRFIGIEGEVTGSIGIKQDLAFGGLTSDTKSPNLLNYSGNLVVSLSNNTSVVPYVIGGVGGMSVFERTALGINDTETFLTGNVGGGVKWYTGRWGLRGDYRFITTRSKEDAPEFFGQETRYGHRVYGGVMLNLGR
jgi:opacity protein-like surface antigen